MAPGTAKLRAGILEGSILAEQIELEHSAVHAGVVRYNELKQEALNRGDGASLKPAESMMLHWLGPLVAGIRNEQRECRRRAHGVGRDIYGAAILSLDAERLAVCTLHEVIGSCLVDPEGVKVSKLAYSVGRAILAERSMEVMLDSSKDAMKELDRKFRRLNPSVVNWWKKRTLGDLEWERRVTVHLGARLLWLVQEHCDIAMPGKPFKLAFRHKKIRTGEKDVAMFCMDRRVFEIIDAGHSTRQFMRPRYLPMIVPPYPWSKETEGGYVSIRTPFISKPTSAQKDAMERADLSGVYECLDAVCAQPWRVNRRIYETAKALWEEGGGVAGLPPAELAERPARPAGLVKGTRDYRMWARDVSHNYWRENVRRRAVITNMDHRLDLAERFVDRDAIYFPHQLDFRGRCYPIPVHLNHQLDDSGRAMLEFADAVKPDYRWLRIHAANCFGFDKASFDDREEWARDHADAIEACAADPIGERWWMEAENPFQFLAACFALHDPDAAARLPVQLDGSCNGLQHYAALGRDAAGAAVVNMTPGFAPVSVYMDVAGSTRAIVQADADAGRDEAIWVLPHINKNTVKQPVMTTVYGVTMVGARDQVFEKLKEAGLESDRLYKASIYLSRIILDGVRDVCPGAAAIMDWIRECARLICKEDHAVEWTTPLGLPVVQPYRRWNKAQIVTILQSIIIAMPDNDVPVATFKQVNGAPPNFIHSIDATHMLMTARACRNAGIAFAEVHDSYWTHAGTVSRLAVILRQQFVALHERPLLADLLAQWRAKWPKVEFPDPPALGHYDIRTVMDSPYFFH